MQKEDGEAHRLMMKQKFLVKQGAYNTTSYQQLKRPCITSGPWATTMLLVDP